MSTLSPPYNVAEPEIHTSTSVTSNTMSAAGPSTASYAPGGCLRMEDAVVETVVTHTTRTTTQFKPLVLPRIIPPEAINNPTHLPTDVYPLADEPTPDDMRFFALKLGGRRVIVQEDPAAQASGSQTEFRGPGWIRHFSGANPLRKSTERVDVLQAVNRAFKGKERKRPHEFGQPTTRRAGDIVPMPVPSPVKEAVGIRQRSPPRKKIRGLDELNRQPLDNNVLLSPLPSPEQEHPPSTASSMAEPDITLPSIGSGLEVAALYSLPTIVSQFDALPDKLQQHVLMHLLRRSRMPTIQRLSAFTAKALRRDFIGLLPHELAINILKKVDVQSLASAARVSKKWRQMIDGESTIWRQRLVDDGMWYGLGVEEEEEEVIRRRMETLTWKDKQDPSFCGMSSDDEEEMESKPNFDVPVQSAALKHVYRKRFQSDRAWLHNIPTHTSFPGHGTNVITCLQFDAEKIVSASDDHSINVYSTATGQLQKRLDGHEGGVWALQYKGDTLVTGSTDRTVRIWDLETLTLAHVFHGHQSTVRCLQIVEPVWDEASGEFQPPYPLVVTGSRDGSLRVWRLPKKGEPAYRRRSPSPANSEENFNPMVVAPEENPYHNHLLAGHSGAVRALAAHGKTCISGSYDATVRVWDIVKGTCIHTLTGHEQRVYSIVYDRYRGRCASGSMDQTVKVWDVVTGQCLQTLSGHTSLVGLLGMSVNHLVSAAADSSLRIWDNNTYTLKNVLSSHSGAITCFQHDETKVVSGSDGTLKLWDIKTGAYIRDLVIGITSVWQLHFNGSLMVAASQRNGATVYDVFDFGKSEPHVSGIDDESLDRLRPPIWERGSFPEPIPNQDEWDELGEEIKPFSAGRIQAMDYQPRRHTRQEHSRRSLPLQVTRNAYPQASSSREDVSASRQTGRAARRAPDADLNQVDPQYHHQRRHLARTIERSHPPPTAGPSSNPRSHHSSSHRDRARAQPETTGAIRITSSATVPSSSRRHSDVFSHPPPMPSGRRHRSSVTVSISTRDRDPDSPTPGSSRGSVLRYASSTRSAPVGIGMITSTGQSFPPIFDELGDDAVHGALDEADNLMDFDGNDVE